MKPTFFNCYGSNEIRIPIDENNPQTEQTLLLCQLTDRSFYTDIDNRPHRDSGVFSYYLSQFGDRAKPSSTYLV
jgi:hypothetical protein